MSVLDLVKKLKTVNNVSLLLWILLLSITFLFITRVLLIVFFQLGTNFLVQVFGMSVSFQGIAFIVTGACIAAGFSSSVINTAH